MSLNEALVEPEGGLKQLFCRARAVTPELDLAGEESGFRCEFMIVGYPIQNGQSRTRLMPRRGVLTVEQGLKKRRF